MTDIHGCCTCVHLFVAGKGDQEPGRPADDLVFVVSEKPHDRFTRSGNDLVSGALCDVVRSQAGMPNACVGYSSSRQASCHMRCLTSIRNAVLIAVLLMFMRLFVSAGDHSRPQPSTSAGRR
jgi:hypothetical protein